MATIGNALNAVSYAPAAAASSCGTGGCSTPTSTKSAPAAATPADAYVPSSASGQPENSLYSVPSRPGASDPADTTPEQLSANAAQTQSRQQQANQFTPAPNFQRTVNVLA